MNIEGVALLLGELEVGNSRRAGRSDEVALGLLGELQRSAGVSVGRVVRVLLVLVRGGGSASAGAPGKVRLKLEREPFNLEREPRVFFPSGNHAGFQVPLAHETPGSDHVGDNPD